MAWNAALLSLVLVLSSQSALAAEPWQLKVYDEGAQPGDRIAYRWAWTNVGDKPVRVPADMFERFVVKGDYKFRMVSAAIGNGVATAPMTTADSVTWVSVRPGDSYQALGELGDYFPACEGGCAAGDYTLAIASAMRHWDALAPDQLDPVPPAFAWHAALQLSSNARLVPVSGGPGLDVAIQKVGNVTAKGDFKVRVTVTNRLAVVVWFPKSSIRTDWTFRTEEGVMGAAEAVVGMASWGPSDGVLLKPGRSHTWIVANTLEPGTQKTWVTATVIDSFPFEARVMGLASRFYFSGRLTTPEIRIR